MVYKTLSTHLNSMKQISENKRFSIVARLKSFSHAGRGLYVFIKSTHNAWVHIFIAALVTVAGLFFGISSLEWVLLVIMFAIVLSAEAFNTAIEIDIDLTSPDFHPYAKDTKDVAAAAVLITAIAACIVGILIFYPYTCQYFGVC